MSGPFTGLRVVLVAAFDRRYHRSGLALAAALESLGCEVRCCEERTRGLNSLLHRPLAARLAVALRRRTTARWANWFPDDPHERLISQRLAPSYDWFFTHDTASLDHHRRAGAR